LQKVGQVHARVLVDKVCEMQPAPAFVLDSLIPSMSLLSLGDYESTPTLASLPDDGDQGAAADLARKTAGLTIFDTLLALNQSVARKASPDWLVLPLIADLHR